MNLSKIIFFTLAGFYATLFVACGIERVDSDSTLEKSDSNYFAAANYLMEKHGAKMLVDSSTTFSGKYQEEVLTAGIVVLDSVVRSVQKIDDEYLMNIEVAGNDSLRVFAQLKCNEEIMSRFAEMNHTSVLISAHIQKIEKLIDEYISENKDLNETITLEREKIMLYGTCDDLVRKPSIYDFNKEKGRG